MENIIQIGLMGATGRMGQQILALAQTMTDQVQIVPVPRAGDDVGSVDAFIDFSQPDGLARHLDMALKYKKPIVIGTTGLTEAQMAQIRDAARQIPVFYAANYSLGIAVLQQALMQITPLLADGFDIQISEIHHRHKKDAPSGTALALGRVITAAGGPAQVAIAAMRGGSVPGEHSVHFLGAEEGLTITHTAYNRAVFARGALHAAQWLVTQSKGLYGMQDLVKM